MLFWLSLCLFVSGASALVYEIAWLRFLALAVGNTAYATSLILAIFLFGLSLGAYLGGRLADKNGWQALRLYGALELGIAVSAPITTWLIKSSPYLVNSLLQRLPDSFSVQMLVSAVVSSLILLPATILMGATLPAVIKLASNLGKQDSWFSWLYGINTLGAVVGSFSAALLGFAYIGITMTTVVAGAFNGLIGMANLWLSRRQPLPDTGVPSSTTGTTNDGQSSRREERYLLALAYLSGFCAVSYEVLWTRMLRFFTGSLTYAFSAMLGTFLAGLAIGSLIYHRFILPRDHTTAERFQRFAKIQYLSAILCAGSLISIPVALLVHVPDSGFALTNPWAAMTNVLLTSLVIIFPPTVVLGILFPLIGTMSVPDASGAASSIGRSYAANTIGCVIGSLLTGLVLIPAIGSYRAFQLMVLISVIAGCTALAATAPSRKRILLGGLLPLLCAIAFCCFVYVPYSTFISIERGNIIKVAEDAIGSMLIIDYPQDDTRVLMMNGSSLATTAMPSRRYMRLLAHLPLLLNPNARSVMVACFGTGTTTGAACLHSGVSKVTNVELSRMVLQNGDAFASSNFSVLHNPKLHPVIADARNFLLRTNDKFDVISFEPPPPCDVGIVNLYTVDFYKLARAHLNGDGFMCQWVPLHDAPERIWKMQVQSAMSVFPYVSVWLPNSGEALLLCATKPPVFDVAAIDRRIHADPTLAKNLHEVGFDSGADVLATFVTDGEDLRNYIGTAPSLTDDKPSLEFFHPYAGALIDDDVLFGLPGFEHKAFSSDARVLASRKALAATFARCSNKSQEREQIERAVKIEPANQWFHWLAKSKTE